MLLVSETVRRVCRNMASIQMSQFVDKVINIDKLRLGTQSWYEVRWAKVAVPWSK